MVRKADIRGANNLGKKGGDGNKNGPTQNGDVEVDMVEYDDTKDLEDKKSKKSNGKKRSHRTMRRIPTVGRSGPKAR